MDVNRFPHPVELLEKPGAETLGVFLAAEGAELQEGAAQLLGERQRRRFGWSGRDGLCDGVGRSATLTLCCSRGRQRCRGQQRAARRGILRRLARQHAFHLHLRAAGTDIAQLPRCGIGEVDHAAMQEGAAVIHPHHHRLAVGEVRHPRVAGQRQRRMRRRHGEHVVGLADGCFLAVELAPVPAADAARLVGFQFLIGHEVLAQHGIGPICKTVQRLRTRLRIGNGVQIGRHAVGRPVVLVVTPALGRRRRLRQSQPRRHGGTLCRRPLRSGAASGHEHGDASDDQTLLTPHASLLTFAQACGACGCSSVCPRRGTASPAPCRRS